MAKSIKIKVTAEHIKAANRWRKRQNILSSSVAKNCPVARACPRSLDMVSVGAAVIRSGKYGVIGLPLPAMQFIWDWDRKLGVQPISFTIEIPQRVKG